MIYAAVDLGTNAFRLLIVDKDKEEIIRRESEIIGLGSHINLSLIHISEPTRQAEIS